MKCSADRYSMKYSADRYSMKCLQLGIVYLCALH